LILVANDALAQKVGVLAGRQDLAGVAVPSDQKPELAHGNLDRKMSGLF
jgi:hypothetical protein